MIEWVRASESKGSRSQKARLGMKDGKREEGGEQKTELESGARNEKGDLETIGYRYAKKWTGWV